MVQTRKFSSRFGTLEAMRFGETLWALVGGLSSKKYLLEHLDSRRTCRRHESETCKNSKTSFCNTLTTKAFYKIGLQNLEPVGLRGQNLDSKSVARHRDLRFCGCRLGDDEP
jgi:hypothetical protein